MTAAYMANNYGMAGKARIIGNTAKNIMLGLAAATIIGTTAACAPTPTSLNAQEIESKTPQVYSITGQPLSVASNCYGQLSSHCNLAVVLQTEDGKKTTLVTQERSDNQAEVTQLEAIIEAEINDQDTETIQVLLDTGYNISTITVEGKTYQP
jgi:hypothetical protein